MSTIQVGIRDASSSRQIVSTHWRIPATTSSGDGSLCPQEEAVNGGFHLVRPSCSMDEVAAEEDETEEDEEEA